MLIYPNGLSEATILSLTMIENLQRLDQTDYQTFVGLDQLEKTGSLQRQEIARLIGKSAGMVTQYLSARDLCPEALEAFKEGRIGVTKAYKVATSPDQLATLDLFLNGETRDEGSRKGRAAKSSETDTEKTEKLPVALAAGVVIIKAKKGQEAINLTGARVLLVDALAKIDHAIKLGYSTKTAVSAWDETKNNVRKPRKPRAAKGTA